MQIIILGMHRSGTSALTRLLHMAGAHFGTDEISIGSSEQNPLGFWERRDVRELNDKLMKSIECDWDLVSDFEIEKIHPVDIQQYQENFHLILKELDEHPTWVLKEPRLCLLFPLLKDLLTNPVCILIYRNPVEVAKSLKARDEIPVAAGLGLWEKYTIDAISACRDLPCFLVDYNDLVTTPKQTINTLLTQLEEAGETQLTAPIGNLINRDLYHKKTKLATTSEWLNQQQLTLYNELKSGKLPKSDKAPIISQGAKASLIEYENAIDDSRVKALIEKVRERNNKVKERSKRAEVLKQQVDSYKIKLDQKDKASMEHDRAFKRQVKALESKQLETQDELKILQIQNQSLNSRLKDQKIILDELQSLMEQSLSDAKAIFYSRRWRLGNFLLSLPGRLLNKPSPKTAFNSINYLKTRYISLAQDHGLKVNEFSLSQSNRDKKPIPYTPLRDGELKKRIALYQESTEQKKIVVYTSITGNYDTLKVPEFIDNRIDYICFTDTPLRDHPIWKFRPALYFNQDSTRIARYYKLHPHTYLKEYDIAIWVDANILIRNDVSHLINRFINGCEPIGIFKHYIRTCTFDEGTECINANKDDGDIISRQINKYKTLGLPSDLGLPETNMLFSRPSDPRVRKIFNTWWREIDNGSRRDQLSIMYSLWENEFNYTPLNQSKWEMARFNRDGFELFLHRDKTSWSHPSKYRIPSFLRPIYDEPATAYWEQDIVDKTPQPTVSKKSFTVDIIIPVHNAIDDVKNCFNSVLANLSKNHSIIIVDDGSSEETRTYLKEIHNDNPLRTTLIRHEAAQGYTKAANAGMKASEADYVILLNSDTVVSNGWSEKLIQCAKTSTAIGIVGPLSNAASWQSIPSIKDKDGSYSVNPLPGSISIEKMNAWCEKYSYSEFPRVQLVNGFCFLITRHLINTIGYFDEESYPKGYNEENDYCFRCSDQGFELAIATNTYVYHAKSKSYTPETRLKLCEESRKVFEGNYGTKRITRATESLRLNPLINLVRSHVQAEWDNDKH